MQLLITVHPEREQGPTHVVLAFAPDDRARLRARMIAAGDLAASSDFRHLAYRADEASWIRITASAVIPELSLGERRELTARGYVVLKDERSFRSAVPVGVHAPQIRIGPRSFNLSAGAWDPSGLTHMSEVVDGSILDNDGSIIRNKEP